MREGVGFIHSPGMVYKSNVVITEHENVLSDATIYLLRAAEVLEVFVIGDNNYSMTGTHEEMSPVFEASDNGKELVVPDGVVAFGGAKGL